MKVAILTQPLLNNYGCLLQNFALQQALLQLGHDPVTLDYMPLTPCRKYRRGVLRALLGRAPYLPLFQRRPEQFDRFVRDHIRVLPAGRKYRRAQLKRGGIEALVVGSDQVWRPIYNRGTLPDMFFRFAGNFTGPRIAYAASFGTDEWPVSSGMRRRCAALAARMTAVSVREAAGVALCRSELGVSAEWMPDPVFLLTASEYLALCQDIPLSENPYVVAYLLDRTPEAMRMVEERAAAEGLSVRFATSGKEAELSVPEWLALLRDAAAVVTDSFHGAAISRLLGKPCDIVENVDRGRSRFAIFQEEISFETLRKRGFSFLSKALSDK